MQRSRILIIVVSVCALIALMAVVLWPQPKPAAASHVAAVSAGGQFTCAVTTAGGVQCWGRNNSGQFGDGTTTDSAVPVDVIDLESGVVAIASGNIHACALTTEGGVQCWGSNSQGQLGAETGDLDSTTPVGVVGLETGVVAIASGDLHTCAVTTAGGVKCWGVDGGWQGYGNTTTPVDVLEEPGGQPLGEIAGITAGGEHTCALTDAGGVKCWGRNGWGQLGNGTISGGRPVDVCQSFDEEEGVCTELLSNVAAIDAGYSHTCALTNAGAIKCWGNNSHGQLGNGDGSYSWATPTDVSGLQSGAAAINAGGLHTCAITTGGGVKCWGMNFFGQVGDGTSTDRPTPVDVLGLSSGVAAVSAGSAYHTCALTDTGAVTCWGGNDYGQTGDSDGDGCTDFTEHGTTAALGGQRDHLDYWDFFDTPDASNYRNRQIDITDIGAVVARFGAIGEPDGDPRSPPPPAPAYHTAFDRGGPIPGENLWNLLPADGSINILDIGAMVVQFGHTCA